MFFIAEKSKIVNIFSKSYKNSKVIQVNFRKKHYWYPNPFSLLLKIYTGALLTAKFHLNFNDSYLNHQDFFPSSSCGGIVAFLTIFCVATLTAYWWTALCTWATLLTLPEVLGWNQSWERYITVRRNYLIFMTWHISLQKYQKVHFFLDFSDLFKSWNTNEKNLISLSLNLKWTVTIQVLIW